MLPSRLSGEVPAGASGATMKLMAPYTIRMSAAMMILPRGLKLIYNMDANIPATPMRSSTLKNLCGPALMKIFLYICHLVLPIFTCLA